MISNTYVDLDSQMTALQLASHDGWKSIVGIIVTAGNQLSNHDMSDDIEDALTYASTSDRAATVALLAIHCSSLLRRSAYMLDQVLQIAIDHSL